jgi:hypothetical protein
MVLAVETNLKPQPLLAVLRVALQITRRGLATAWQRISSDLIPDTRKVLAMETNLLSILAVNDTLNLGTLLAALRAITLIGTG